MNIRVVLALFLCELLACKKSSDDVAAKLAQADTEFAACLGFVRISEKCNGKNDSAEVAEGEQSLCGGHISDLSSKKEPDGPYAFAVRERFPCAKNGTATCDEFTACVAKVEAESPRGRAEAAARRTISDLNDWVIRTANLLERKDASAAELGDAMGEGEKLLKSELEERASLETRQEHLDAAKRAQVVFADVSQRFIEAAKTQAASE